MTYTVAVVVGSLRRDSWNQKLARAFVLLAPPNLTFRFSKIADLPFMDQDREDNPPPQWTRFRDEITNADAVLFVTPEYNRSIPGVLKNAIDVGSRPFGRSVFSGKPAGIVTASIGSLGGFGANHHLRQSLAFLNMPTLPAEAYIGVAHNLFDEAGELKDGGTRELLSGFATVYAKWIEDHLLADRQVA